MNEHTRFMYVYIYTHTHTPMCSGLVPKGLFFFFFNFGNFYVMNVIICLILQCGEITDDGLKPKHVCWTRNYIKECYGNVFG
jgi:hypothetical protein